MDTELETDLEFVALMRKHRLLDEKLIERLVLHWHTENKSVDNFVDYLQEHGVVNRQCEETLTLARRGVLSRVQTRQVFTVRYRDRIDDLLGQAGAGRQDQLKRAMRTTSIEPRGPIVLPGAGETAIRGLSERRSEIAVSPSTEPQVSLPVPPKVGDRLGKCLLTSELASGASAVVFEALHQTLQVSVAVKVFQPNHPKHDQQMRRQFGDEARMLARLNHPNIVRILDFEESPNLFLVLEFINGFSLSDLLNGSGHLAVPQGVRIAQHVASALAFAHSEGVVHRDVKPANIMIDRSGQVKLADLGIALLSDALNEGEQKRSDVLCGTPAYVAPEQAFKPGEADARSDIYSLGATIYQAITGSLPFEAENARDMVMRHVSGKLISPRALRPEMPQELADLVMAMMAKKPDDRPQSMTDVVDTLKVIRANLEATDKDGAGLLSGRKGTGGVSTILRRSLAMLRRSDSSS